jgi:hypothetical protein
MTIVTIKTMTATCCWAGVVFFFLELQGASPALFKKQKKKKKKKKTKHKVLELPAKIPLLETYKVDPSL